MNNCTKAHMWKIGECPHCKIQALQEDRRKLLKICEIAIFHLKGTKYQPIVDELEKVIKEIKEKK